MGFGKVILWILGIIILLVAIVGVFLFITNRGIIDTRGVQERACIERGEFWIDFKTTRSLTDDNFDCEFLLGGECVNNAFNLGTNIGGNKWIVGRCSSKPSCVFFSTEGGACSDQ